jgi:hypothetical protein
MDLPGIVGTGGNARRFNQLLNELPIHRRIFVHPYGTPALKKIADLLHGGVKSRLEGQPPMPPHITMLKAFCRADSHTMTASNADFLGISRRLWKSGIGNIDDIYRTHLPAYTIPATGISVYLKKGVPNNSSIVIRQAPPPDQLRNS